MQSVAAAPGWWVNVLLVLTNAPAGWAAWRAAVRGQVAAALCLVAAGTASVLYHGAESHKHQHVTPGLGYAQSAAAQYWLLQLDRACAALAFVGTVATAKGPAVWGAVPLALCLLVCVGLSEKVAPMFADAGLHRWTHAVFHALWHVGAFLLADAVLAY